MRILVLANYSNLRDEIPAIRERPVIFYTYFFIFYYKT